MPAALLDAAAQLGVRRIISFGGVTMANCRSHDKERAVSCICSQRELQANCKRMQ